MARDKYSTEVKFNIIREYKNRKTISEISRIFIINKSIISRLISKYKATGTVDSQHKGGRRRKTTKREDKMIKRQIIKNPKVSSGQIVKNLSLEISERTVRRRAVEAGLCSYRSAKKPFISAKNRKLRLEFARKYLSWTPEKWKLVLFSDESKFKLRYSDGLVRVRRPKGERLKPKYCTPTFKFGGGGVLVWGCFSGFGMGPILLLDGIMDRFVYLDILKNIMLPHSEEQMPLLWTFQHDNDPKHTSKVVENWIKEQKIKKLQWPPQSPDLNPIENLWEIVNSRINREECNSTNALFYQVKKAWDSINMDTIDKLINSMPNRLKEVIKNNGYSTKY